MRHDYDYPAESRMRLLDRKATTQADRQVNGQRMLCSRLGYGVTQAQCAAFFASNNETCLGNDQPCSHGPVAAMRMKERVHNELVLPRQ